MHGAVAKVDQFLRMSDGPVRAAATFMAVVRAGDGVAAAQGLCKGGGIDGTCPTAVAFLPVWPFQADAAGSQRANLMFESRLGRVTPRTSQCAGTAPGPADGAPGAAGAGAARSGTLVAAVMSVYGSFTFSRFSHPCCAYAAWLLNRIAAGMSHETLVGTLAPLADLRSAPHR